MNPDREYERHISDNHVDRKSLAWCGTRLQPMEWSFTGIDHAAMNARNEGRLTTCPACVRAVIGVFAKEPHYGEAAD